jgi:hypothetical protein
MKNLLNKHLFEAITKAEINTVRELIEAGVIVTDSHRRWAAGIANHKNHTLRACVIVDLLG